MSISNFRYYRFMLLAMLLGVSTMAQAAESSVRLGSILPLSGAGQAAGGQVANGVRLAVSNMNAVGGVNGHHIKLLLENGGTNPMMSVQAAKELVDIDHVPAIIGAWSSGSSMPILTSVAAPSHTVLISPASSSIAFTALAKSGKTGGYWFRTTPSSAIDAVGMAKLVSDKSIRRVAVIYLNNVWGIGVKNVFVHMFKRLGGTITSSVAYSGGRPTYGSVINEALKNNPQALVLAAFPVDGERIVRSWISLGGPRTFFFTGADKEPSFIKAINPKYIDHAWGTVGGTVKTPSLATFNKMYTGVYGHMPTAGNVTNAYDATIIVGLAMEAGHCDDGTCIRDHIRDVTGSKGVPIYAGPAEFKKAKTLLAAGKKIRYVGAIGPITFDAYGNISTPVLIWSVDHAGAIKNVSTIGLKEINALKKMAAEN